MARLFPISQYFSDVKSESTTPQVVFIDRGGGSSGLDEHPRNNIMASLFGNLSANEPGQREPLVAGLTIWSCDESGIAPELWHRMKLSKN